MNVRSKSARPGLIKIVSSERASNLYASAYRFGPDSVWSLVRKLPTMICPIEILVCASAGANSKALQTAIMMLAKRRTFVDMSSPETRALRYRPKVH
jgi:hypothetical protein